MTLTITHVVLRDTAAVLKGGYRTLHDKLNLQFNAEAATLDEHGTTDVRLTYGDVTEITEALDDVAWRQISDPELARLCAKVWREAAM